MRPPLRPRSAPARFRAAPGGAAAAAAAAVPPTRAAWTAREKRALLRALRDQAALGLPEPQPWRMKERLPRRSEAEIRWELTRLRGRAAREALSSQHRKWLREEQQNRERRPAPIEIWLQLAQTVSGPLEEAAAAAFSQALTVAGTEPLSLKGGALGVDYGRLYGILARGARGGDGPELQPAEAAVLLALLASLPPQLQALPHISPLRRHLRGSYSSLSAPQSPPRPHSPPPKSPWKAMGLCPLNPFLLPLWLLRGPAPPPQ